MTHETGTSISKQEQIMVEQIFRTFASMDFGLKSLAPDGKDLAGGLLKVQEIHAGFHGCSDLVLLLLRPFGLLYF